MKSMLHEFRSLDLAVKCDMDYKIVLENSEYCLILATEKGSRASLLASIRDSKGQEFEVGLSEEILAKQEFKANIEALDEVKERYQLDSAGGDEHSRAAGAYVYAKVATRQVFSFVSRFNREMLDENGPFRAEYRSREQMLLKDLGL